MTEMFTKAVPDPTVSPTGADVENVITGELITAEWGTAVAEDLAELWAAVGTGGGSGPDALFTASTQGEVPASGGSSTDYLCANGIWSAPAGAGGGGGITTEDAVDAVAGALVATGGITKVYNDPANTITLGLDADVSTLVSRWQTATPTTSDSLAFAEPLNNGSNVASIIVPALAADRQFTLPDASGIAALTSDLAVKADKSTAIAVTAPITGGGSLGTPAAIGITDFTTVARGAVPSPGGASSGRFLKDDGTWTLPPSAASGVSNVFPFTYNTSTLESITGSQLRGNNATFTASTKLWVSETTVDGLDVTVGLGRVKAGFQVYIQDYTSASRYALFNVTADAIDKGTYWEITVALASSAGSIPGGKVAFQSLSAAAANKLFSTTSTAAGLTPGSNGVGTTNFLRADGTWAVPPGGSGGSTIVQQPSPPADTSVLWADTDEVGIEENVRYLSNVTGSAYTLVLGDRGKLLLCSNATSQIVTVPTNASAGFLIGTQLDLVQTGAGVLTIAGASGVVVNATPSLVFRARYSAASLIKVGTDTWLLLGDLA